MRRPLAGLLALAALWLCAAALSAGGAAAAACEPRAACFDLDSVGASLTSTQPEVPPTQAGSHPDLTLSFGFTQDPDSAPNAFELHESYARLRNLRIDVPPGLLGDPNVLGLPQQCTLQELVGDQLCPDGSQVGRTKVFLYALNLFDRPLIEPLYMMVPPEGGDIIARLGFIAGNAPALIDVRVRSHKPDDFGLSFELSDITSLVQVVGVETTTWGVPAAPVHDTERCRPKEALAGCIVSEARPPGTRPLSFITNPTRCGVPLAVTVTASSWEEPNREITGSGQFPTITGCDRVPFNPSLFAAPTSRVAAAPTGLELSFRLPAPDGVGVLESSHLKDMRIQFPPAMTINPASAAGLSVCSAEQVRLGENVAAECPDAAKLGETEFEIPALPRRMKGALYLRAPEPGHLFRLWVVADDLGAHLKLPAELELDPATGQITSIVLNLPQAPVREVKLVLKSGFRAPLVNPPACGTYQTHWQFTPWARPSEPVSGDSPMTIDEGCATGGFSPRLAAGTTNPAPATHAPFVFSLDRSDGEQGIATIDLAFPEGIAATFRGVERCTGLAAETGACPPNSRVGRLIAASGAGPNPLWVPEPGKDPTAVYLGGPYRGAPLSVIVLVPAQAGPFDLGEIVVRSAVYVDPVTARVRAVSDPIPQSIEGVPLLPRTIEVAIDRPGFHLTPTSCEPKQSQATLTSPAGALATPSALFQLSGCAALGFRPRIALRLRGATRRGANPALSVVLRPRPGDANISRSVVTLPRSAFLDQSHIRTVCTRAAFRADACPAGSVYGHVRAFSPLFDEPLEGPAVLRSSDNLLPDLVFDLHGLVDIEAAGRIDSVRGGIRASFDAIPDAPLTRVEIQMRGGKRSLIVNSANLCSITPRADVRFAAHNGARRKLKPLVRTDCGAKKKGSSARGTHPTAHRSEP